MDARKFLDTFGADECRTVAKAAGTNLAYFKQIAYKARAPGPDLAKALAAASDGRMHRGELRPDLWGDEVTDAAHEASTADA